MIVVPAVMLAALGASCAAIETGTIAVRRPADRRIDGLEIVLGRCDAERNTLLGGWVLGNAVTEVTVRGRAAGPAELEPASASGDPVLWAIRSDTPRPLGLLLIGEAPDGFETTTPLAGALPRVLEVEVLSGEEGDRSVGDLDVDLDVVPPESSFVLADDGVISEPEFLDRVRVECEGEDREPWGRTLDSLLVRVFLVSAGGLAVLAAVVWLRQRGTVWEEIVEEGDPGPEDDEEPVD